MPRVYGTTYSLTCMYVLDTKEALNLWKSFCCVFRSIQVLATGLSALYSDLPTTCSYSVDEWQSPLPVIEACVPELSRFYQALEFCNSVLQVTLLHVLEIVYLTHISHYQYSSLISLPLTSSLLPLLPFISVSPSLPSLSLPLTATDVPQSDM